MLREVQRVARGLPATFEVISGPRADVVQEVRRALARGEVRMVDPGLHLMADGITVYAKIQRVRPRPQAWRKPALVTGGTLVALGMVAYVAWLLVSALVAVAVPLAGVAVAVAVVTLVRRVAGGGSVEVLQRVTVRR